MKQLVFTFALVVLTVAVRAQAPNILWIVLEDTSPQFIGAYGNTGAHTPHIDSFARTATRFTRAFAPAPVCAIARSALITGMDPRRLGTGHHRSAYPIPGYVRGFPAYLRDEGYYTTNNAKKDYNTSREAAITRESWNESSNRAGWWKRAPGQPFFSVFNINDSHQSRTMTHPRAWYEEFVLQHLPEHLRTSPETVLVPPFLHDSPAMRRELARVQNSINYADVQVGALLDRLHADGLADSTIVFVYADHGEAIPGGKCTPTSFGYRVPLLVHIPSAFRDKDPWRGQAVSDELVTFLDFGPSVIALGGGAVPDYMEGRVLTGPQPAPAPEYLFAGRDRLDETPDLSRSVTDGRYVYTRHFLPAYPPLAPQKYVDVADIARLVREDGRKDLLDPVQKRLLEARPHETLYDLSTDSWETTDLTGDPAHRPELLRLRAALNRHLLESRDILFLPERDLARLEMPYTFRQDTVAYPFGRILEAATIDPESGLARMRTLMDDQNATVRYWAVSNLAHRALSDRTSDYLQDALGDRDSLVAVVAAGGLLRGERLAETVTPAVELLRDALGSDRPHLVLATLQQIQSAPAWRHVFVEDLKALLPRLAALPDQNLRYVTSSSAETTLYLEGEAPLFYENMRKWLSR